MVKLMGITNISVLVYLPSIIEVVEVEMNFKLKKENVVESKEK